MYDCLGLGIISLDYICLIDHYPAANSKNRFSRLVQQGGGPVPTALATLSKLGLSCALISKLGRDQQAEWLLAELDTWHIASDYMLRTAAATPFAIILCAQDTATRTVFLHRRGDNNLSAEEVQHLLAVMTPARLLHLDGHETEAALPAARWAREKGITVSLDIGSPRFVPAELLRLVDILIVSRDYLAPAGNDPDYPLLCQKLLKYGARLVGITCGEQGSYLATPHEVCYQPAFRVKVVDSTGAGDVYHGAALFGWLNGFDLGDIARFASACAALKCRQAGGKTAIPALAQVRSFLSQRGEPCTFLHAIP